MDAQRSFDFPRAAKLNALERVPLGASVKALLKALDGFIRDKPRDTVTLKRLALSMGCSPKTAQRATRTAEAAGLVTTYTNPTDGTANTYAINWSEIFNLPEATKQPRTKNQEPSTTTPTPGQFVLPPRSICPPPPVNLTAPPGQFVRGVPPPTKTDKETATTDHAGRTGEGGDFETDPRTAKPWCWNVTRAELAQQSTVLDLYRAAVAAGILSGLQIDQIRFLALVLKIRADETIRNPPGYLVKLTETHAWNYLPTDALKKAWNQIRPGQPPPTPEQIARLKQPQREQPTICQNA